MIDQLEKSIISTIVYYDVLNYPLTNFEIFKYLIKSNRQLTETPEIKFSDIEKALKESPLLKDLLAKANGFYFLKGRREIVKERINRHKIADKKWKKTRRIVKLLQAVPYLKMVAGSGSLALNNTRKESDLDLLIVTKNGRIWTTRALVTFLVSLIGQRRHGQITADKICLNHYITDQSLTIKFASLYNAQTYAHLVPLISSGEINLSGFYQANPWIKDYLFSLSPAKVDSLKAVKPSRSLKALAKTGEFILNNKLGDWLEIKLANYQKKHINKDPLRYGEGGRVITEDSQLEFHPNSPEKNIVDKYNRKMTELGVPELAHEKDSGLY